VLICVKRPTRSRDKVASLIVFVGPAELDIRRRTQWTLGAKLALVSLPFLALALLSIGVTLWLSWQLEGGAAAINEAGRMRMQAYRMSLSVGTAAWHRVPALSSEFQNSLQTLRSGDPERPLFVPWDDAVRTQFQAVEADWQRFRSDWIDQRPASTAALTDATGAFVAHIEDLVAGIEAHMARWTALLHLSQVGMMALAVFAAAVLIYTGYLFVLEPVSSLKHVIGRMREGDLSARVEQVSSDEFGTLAEGFNVMAGQVQSMYRNLEARVTEKTTELQEKGERLETLYDVTALVTRASTLTELARGFADKIAEIVRADAVSLMWRDESNTRFVPLAAAKGDTLTQECTCARADLTGGVTVLSGGALSPGCTLHGSRCGCITRACVPITAHDHVAGYLDLRYCTQRDIAPAERSLLEALAAHLATGMENLRLNALEKEAAVSQERGFLARELHDSIAQSLAFLKIQVQLMRDALDNHDERHVKRALEEIDTGVRESYADVRELLVHFRTRVQGDGIEEALNTTLRKFEQQAQIPAVLNMSTGGLPLPADVQVQVLHVIQEALSNVRKHAHASQVWLDVQQQPCWRFEVRDDGRGFSDTPDRGETHVGLRIMRERAERISAELEVHSRSGRGTSVILTLSPQASAVAIVERVTAPA